MELNTKTIQSEYYIAPLIILNLILIVAVSLNYIYAGVFFVGFFGMLYLIKEPVWPLAIIINASYILYLAAEPFDKTDALTLVFKGAILIGLIIVWWRYSVQIKVLQNPIILLSLILGILLFFGIKYSPSPLYGYTKTLHYFLINFLIVFSVYFLSYNIKNIEKLLILIAFFGLILGISGVLKILLGLETGARLTVFDINTIWVSRYSAFSIIIIFYLYKRFANSMLLKTLFLFSVFILFLTMVFTASRGPLIGLFLVFSFYYLFFSKQSFSQKLTAAIMVLIFMLVTLLFLPEQIFERLTDFGSRKDISGVMRVVWVTKILPVIKSQYLLGIGTGGFSKLIMGVDMRAYPHNLFAEIGLENGIVGLVVLALFLYYTVKYARILIQRHKKNPNIQNLSICALMIFLFALFNSMFSGDVPANEQIWFAAGIITGIYTYN